MGNSLYHSTTTALSDDAIASIEKETYGGPNTWWGEALSFHSSDGGMLSGGTKLWPGPSMGRWFGSTTPTIR